MDLFHLYRPIEINLEFCFNIQASEPLTVEEWRTLKLILAEGFMGDTVKEKSVLNDQSNVAELGPRMNFATAYSTNLVSACRMCGLHKVLRIERSRRYLLAYSAGQEKFIRENHDRMTECHYR